MRTQSKASLKKLMTVSDKIADLNHERFKNFLPANEVEGDLDGEAANNFRPAVCVAVSLCRQPNFDALPDELTWYLVPTNPGSEVVLPAKRGRKIKHGLKRNRSTWSATIVEIMKVLSGKSCRQHTNPCHALHYSTNIYLELITSVSRFKIRRIWALGVWQGAAKYAHTEQR